MESKMENKFILDLEGVENIWEIKNQINTFKLNLMEIKKLKIDYKTLKNIFKGNYIEREWEFIKIEIKNNANIELFGYSCKVYGLKDGE